MATIQERQEEATEKLEQGTAIVRQFANGGPDQTVSTLSGPIPTLAKFLQDTGGGLDQIAADAATALSTAEQAQADVAGAVTAANAATAAVATKANINSPTFTGTVSGITAAMVGLGNVNNTSDAAKPISTATQTALNLKANLASPTFTGTVSGITKAMVGLGNVDNTSDLNKPVSTATAALLGSYAPINSPTFTGTVTVTNLAGATKAMVGLGNVDNTTDLGKPISTATQTALDLKANTSALASYAPLASPVFTGVPVGTTRPVGTNTTALATTAFVQSALGTLTKASVGLGNVDNTSDLDKPVSTATQEALAAVVAGDLEPALAGKANVNNTNLTGTMTAEAATFSGAVTFNAPVTGIDKSEVGLGNVDNTADTAKPVSTAQQTALNLKANLASPTFTGSPAVPLPAASDNTNRIASTSWVNTAISTGLGTVTKSSIGLGNVDNTSDANKPVSTAQQTALDLKANLASPALTGTPTAPTAANGTNTTQIATTAHVLAGLNLKANLASPTFSGTPSMPTPAAGTNNNTIATTAYVTSAAALKASLTGADFTGMISSRGLRLFDAAGANRKTLSINGGVFRVLNTAETTELLAVDDSGNLTTNGNLTTAALTASSSNVTGGATFGSSATFAVRPTFNGQTPLDTGNFIQGWTNYSPTLSSATGTLANATAAGQYVRVGNFVMFSVVITVVNKGTAVVPIFTLPFNVNASQAIFYGRNSTDGKMVQGAVGNGSAAVSVYNYDNSDPLSSGVSSTIIVNGTYMAG